MVFGWNGKAQDQASQNQSRRSRIFAEATGFGPLKGALRNSAEMMGRSAKVTGDLARETLKPDVHKQVGPAVPDSISLAEGQALFAAQVARTPGVRADLPRRQRAAERRFEFYVIASVMMLMLGIAGLFDGPVRHLIGGASGLGIVLPWFLMLPLLSKAAANSFWAWQLRYRTLGGLRLWLRNPQEWVPPSSPMRRGVKILVILALGHAVLSSHPAYAAGATTVDSHNIIQSLLGNLGSGDLSLQWMQRLFPSAMSSSVSYGSDAVAQMFQALNVVLVGLAGVILTWHTISGLVATAHDGTVLGRKWHTTWAPIRIAVGIAGTVPVAGYCAAQLLAIKVLLAGFGLANVAWSSYLNMATGMNGTEAVVVAPMLGPQESVFDTAVAAQSCVDLATYQYTNGQSAPVSVQQAATNIGTLANGLAAVSAVAQPSSPQQVGGQYVWDWGPVCGRIAYTDSSHNLMTRMVSGSSGFTSPDAPMGSMSVPTDQTVQAAATARTTFEQDRATAFTRFLSDLKASNLPSDLAQTHAKGGQPVQQGQLTTDLASARDAFSTYQAAVLTAAGTMQASERKNVLSAIQSDGTTLGWASAGSLQSRLVRLSAQVADAAQELPAMSFVNVSMLGDKEFSTEMGAVLQTVAIGTMQITPSAAGPSGAQANAAMSASVLIKSLESNPSSAMSVLGQATGQSVMANFLHVAGNLNTLDPLGDIEHLGVAVKSLGYTAILTMASVNGAVKALENGSQSISNIPVIGWIAGTVSNSSAGFLAGFLSSIMVYWQTVAGWLIIIGLAMQIVLPMLQYMIWLSAVAGVIVFCVEVVAGSAFWAFSHVRADGDELINQQQGYGYALLTNSLFRPTLMVIGLIFANVVLAVVASFINSTFVLAANNMSGILVDPFAICLLLGILFYLHYQVAVRAFHLVTMLPNAVLAWIGQPGADLRYADFTEGENKHRTIVAGMSNRVQETRGLGGRMKEKTLTNSNKGQAIPASSENPDVPERITG